MQGGSEGTATEAEALWAPTAPDNMASLRALLAAGLAREALLLAPDVPGPARDATLDAHGPATHDLPPGPV